MYCNPNWFISSYFLYSNCSFLIHNIRHRLFWMPFCLTFSLELYKSFNLSIHFRNFIISIYSFCIYFSLLLAPLNYLFLSLLKTALTSVCHYFVSGFDFVYKLILFSQSLNPLIGPHWHWKRAQVYRICIVISENLKILLSKKASCVLSNI
jgi:hypothetical protein